MKSPVVGDAAGEDRLRVALDPGSSGTALWRLAMRYWREPAIARALAANPGAPKLLLRRLARGRWDVAATVARNPRCPHLLRPWLASESYWAGGAAVAVNPAADATVLAELANWPDARIRLYAAANPSLPESVVECLLSDPSRYVRGVAAANPAAPAAGLSRLADGLSEPAWILRAIAANPACPAELSGQLLTWIALGGPGHEDPMFDPVECTGHPGDTSVAAVAWYREQASTEAAARHSLWRVRAGFPSARRRVPFHEARMLARDPRAEVRRAVAGLTGLPLGCLRELCGDADPSVARLAGVRLEAEKSPAGKKRRRARAARALPLAIAPGVAVVVGLEALVSQLSPLNSPAPVQYTRGPASAGIGTPGAHTKITSTYRLAGAGLLRCGSAGSVAFVSVTAGSSGLTVRMTGAVTLPGKLPITGPVHIPAGSEAEFGFPASPPRVSVAPDPVAGSSSAAQPMTARCR
jgi:hypothetical protein